MADSVLSVGEKLKPATDLNRLMDMYWGGSERRITGLTLRILGVNVIALLMLVFGVMFLGQYHNNLIEARLQTFQREVELVSVIVNESAFTDERGHYRGEEAARIVDNLKLGLNKQVYIFDARGELVLNTANEGVVKHKRLRSVEILKDILQYILFLLPDRRELPVYPEIGSVLAKDYPGVAESLEGEMRVTAWSGHESRVFLTASLPLVRDDQVWGALLMTWEGHEIVNDINDIWVTLLSIFGGTLILTIFLSIYLAGIIAYPLKKLAKAAENVKKGRAKAEDIPDMSDRMDEIGELSLVLREMTMSLSDKMDSIECFAADVAHELKNPLTSLRSAVETLSVVKAKKDKEKLMSIVQHDINRLDRLITDISRASRLDAELSRQAFNKVDLRMALLNVLRVYQGPLDKVERDQVEGWAIDTVHEGVRIIMCSTLKRPVYVNGYEGHLMQVFDNIVSNALSFSPIGGTVSINVSMSGRYVSIVIENEGPSIPEGKEETIFERFYSERPEYEAYGENSGLGLSISRQIVEAHGGQIYAENIVGGEGAAAGVRFVVLLNKA